MSHYNVLTYRDASGELSNMTVHNGAITAVSIAGFLTDFGDLKTAVDALVIGQLATEMWVGDKSLVSRDLPASDYAQRENKWLVTYEGDTSHKLFQIEIPTADAALRNQNNDDIDITAAPFAAFVTAFETIARSPDSDVETVTVRGMKFVGRNL